MNKTEIRWRRTRAMSLVLRKRWEWLHDLGGRVNGLRSPRGTVFEARLTRTGYLARRAQVRQVVDA